jgi:glycosyltransferase involved in cell wall biosynthesis
MHIACIAADLIPGKLGGAEVHCVEVVKRLSQKHTITLFVGEDTSIQKLFSKNVTVVPVKYPKIPNLTGLAYILFAYPQISSYFVLRTSSPELAEGSHPDIIWSKQCYPQSVLGARLAKKFNLPHYITAQNPRLLHEELVVKGSLLKPLHSWLATMLDPLIKRAFASADLVAAVSTYSAEAAKEYGAKKVVIIPNGISPGDFKMHKYSPKKTWTLFTASSLIPRNGIDTLIDAVALLPKSLSWKLIIAGDGPDREKLVSLVKTGHGLSLQNQITFLGRVPNQDIPRLLSESDLFIRPSRHEGFGISFLEAMASGVPVIATPVGGIVDFVTDQKTGLLVPPDNPNALADAIVKLTSNKNLYLHLQGHAMDLARKHYNWDTITRQVESEMLKILRTSYVAPRT